METVQDIMTTDLLTVSANTTLRDAHKHMGEKQTRHILITDDDKKLIGILSDRDVKKYVSPFAGSNIASDRDKATLGLQLDKIMSKNLKTIRPEKTVKDCIKMMLEHSINSLPVLDEDEKLVGIITSTNIFQFVLKLIQ